MSIVLLRKQRKTRKEREKKNTKKIVHKNVYFCVVLLWGGGEAAKSTVKKIVQDKRTKEKKQSSKWIEFEEATAKAWKRTRHCNDNWTCLIRDCRMGRHDVMMVLVEGRSKAKTRTGSIAKLFPWDCFFCAKMRRFFCDVNFKRS